MTDKDMNYLKELAWKVHGIKDDFQRAVYYRICIGFQLYKQGKSQTKNVTKEQILGYLCKKGLAVRRADGKLPDDRKVREAARELLKQGLPVIATARSKGYYIAETLAEIDKPQRENKARALAILDVDKGYEKVRALLMGQGRIFGA